MVCHLFVVCHRNVLLQAAFLLLRTWTDMPPENEFRAFVRGGAVTAITQYATQATLPALQDAEARRRVARAMVMFICCDVLPRLPQEPYRAACVVDLSWTAAGLAAAASTGAPASDSPDSPGSPCASACASACASGLCVVELNPFCRRTGAGLYSWRADWSALAGSAPQAASVSGRAGDRLVAFRFRSEGPEDDTIRVAAP